MGQWERPDDIMAEWGVISADYLDYFRDIIFNPGLKPQPKFSLKIYSQWFFLLLTENNEENINNKWPDQRSVKLHSWLLITLLLLL